LRLGMRAQDWVPRGGLTKAKGNARASRKNKSDAKTILAKLGEIRDSTEDDGFGFRAGEGVRGLSKWAAEAGLRRELGRRIYEREPSGRKVVGKGTV